MRRLGRRVANLVRQPWARRRLVPEAMVALAKARLAERRFGQFGAIDLVGTRLASVKDDPSDSPVIAKDIGWAITAAAKTVPWRATCLPQALAAAQMLTKRDLPWVLHVGLDHDDARALLAHAWVTNGRRVVVGGGDGFAAFTRLTAYSPRG